MRTIRLDAIDVIVVAIKSELIQAAMFVAEGLSNSLRTDTVYMMPYTAGWYHLGWSFWHRRYTAGLYHLRRYFRHRRGNRLLSPNVSAI